MSSKNSDSDSNPSPIQSLRKSFLTTSGMENLPVSVALPQDAGKKVERANKAPEIHEAIEAMLTKCLRVVSMPGVQVGWALRDCD